MEELSFVLQSFQIRNEYPSDTVCSVLKLFAQNGITCIADYAALGYLQRAMVGLPVLIEHDLIRMIIETKGISLDMTSLKEYMNSLPPKQISPIKTSLPVSQSLEKFTANNLKRQITSGMNGYCYVFHNIAEKEIIISVRDCTWRYSDNIPLKNFLSDLSEPGKLYTSSSADVFMNGNTKLELSFVPGRILSIGSRFYPISFKIQFKGIENWLASLKLSHLTRTFRSNYIDDFLVLPFLREEDVDHMSISESDKEKILHSVRKIRNGGNAQYFREWLKFLGFGQYADNFVDNYFDICFLNRLKESHLERIGIHPSDRAQIFEIIRQYSEFSSVEATYIWLQENGFEKVSFRFVRFNIPFYALPMVNFFIIHEMGIVNHKELLSSLERLKTTPAYRVKAMAYWLRDLELERYSLEFAKNAKGNFIESISHIRTEDINRLIEWNDDREKMKCAVTDMSEFQQYFSTTARLVEDLMMDKYGHLFLTHDIPIDMIPELDDIKLQSIGITNAKDRETILVGVEKMKKEFPEVCCSAKVSAGWYSNSSQRM